MTRSARFALQIGLLAGLALPALAADPPPANQKKEDKKTDKGKAAPSKDTPADQRLERQKTRMAERDKEIDRRLNKRKK